jgi:hypothetical protein
MDVVDMLEEDSDDETADDKKEDSVTAPTDWDKGDETDKNSSENSNNENKNQTNDNANDHSNGNVEQTGGYGELF